MPIPSEVPTSFVPHVPVPSANPGTTHLDLFKMFLFSSLGIFTTILLASGGIFLYQHSLEGQLTQRQVQLKGIEKTLNQANVRDFVHLRDQLSSSQILLDKHLTLSRVFDLLETVTVNRLSLTGLKISIPKGKPATIELEGLAANFNTLATQAVLLKKNRLLSNTVFSGFSLKKGGAVGFTFNATLNSSLVQNFVAVVGVASSTTATLATTTPEILNATATTTKTTSVTTSSTSITSHTP